MIIADLIHKLNVNGNLIEIGSSKGEQKNWYYDIVDLASHLVERKNILGVIVLRYPLVYAKDNSIIVRTHIAVLFLEGEYVYQNGETVSLSEENLR